jgi:glutathione S-transferase
MLPFPPRVHAKEYLALNVLGTVPLLIDGETRMTESAGACQYLAVRYGPTPLAVDPKELGYGAWLNWLHLGEATLTFPQTLVLRYGRFEPEERRSQQVTADYSRWFLARLRGAEAVLSTEPYICAGRFTVADISVGYALMLADMIGLLPQAPPNTQAYWRRLTERQAYGRALSVQKRTAEEHGLPTDTVAIVGEAIRAAPDRRYESPEANRGRRR